MEPQRTGAQTARTGVRLHLIRLGRRHPRLGKQPRAGRWRERQNRPLPLRTRQLRPRGPSSAPPTDAPAGPAELHRCLRHRPRPAVDPHPASAADRRIGVVPVRPPRHATRTDRPHRPNRLERAVQSVGRSQRATLGMGTTPRPKQPDQVSRPVPRSRNRAALQSV